MSAVEPFYAGGAGERRAFEEQALLAREYPAFVMDVDEDGTPFVLGTIGPTTELRQQYHVLVEMPPGYGHGALPRAHVLSPEIRPGAPHRYQDGTLCVEHGNAFTKNSTMITFLAWVAVWLHLYEGWLETGDAW